MKQVPDRRRLRREYLRRKGKAYSKTAFYSTLCVLMWVTVGFCFYNLIQLLHWSHYKIGENIAFTALLGAIAIWFTMRLRRSEKEAKGVLYVPPVTPEILPADEILVRGSEEPPVEQSEVLLRAAQGQETPKEELLRVAKE